MRYRNIKTGQIIDIHTKLSSKNWIPLNDGKPEIKGTAVEEPAAEVENEVIPAKKTTRRTSTRSKYKK